MSAYVKGKLKSAREAIGKKDYESAREAANSVLDYEPDNYNANVFLGVAFLELGQVDQSEQAYRKAIDANPAQILAWQGITKLYERTKKWEKYEESLQHIAHLYAKTNDAVKCAETLQKFIELRRSRGTRVQLADALSLFLPDSPIYSVLSTLPPPDPTSPSSTTTFFAQSSIYNSLPVLEEIIALHEREEEETIKNEVAKRRTRLGAAGPEQIKKDVGRDVWGPSKLPLLYNEVLNHPNTSDELRRATESKLLRHRQQLLFALPTTGELAVEKARITSELQELVNGMVLLGIPDELAWDLFIEAKDAETIESYDIDILRKYIHLFPTSHLSKLLIGYFGYQGISISDDESEDGHSQNEEEEDYVDTVFEAFNSLPNSILAHRVVAELYEHEEDLQNTIKVAESGLELVRRSEKNLGCELPLVRKAFNITLATALVHLFPPKHHIRALRIIDDILANNSDNIRCLMGRAYILQFAKKWGEAGSLFSKVAEIIPEDLDQGIRAKEEFAWCQVQSHDPDAGAQGLKAVLDTLDALEGREVDQARCWWRLGKCYWDMGDSSREEAYQHFITALKRSSTYAPAFTSLGIYYAEYASPPDPKRASKCFQKAFELDPREADAARRLAEGFAEEREWDLVEVVARRTIDGEGGLEGGAEAAAVARYLPLNAWAWKALGVVELNRQRYSEAIQAFQIALRTDVDDQLSWLRLGEAYSKGGRFAAALKALSRAKELNPDDWISLYFIGEVQRQMGQYEEAIDAFKDILVDHPSELNVLMSLGQTYLDLGHVELMTAFTARAEASFASAIRVVLELLDASSGFRRIAWKMAADALYNLSLLASYSDEETVRSILSEVVTLVSDHPRERLSGIISLPPALGGPAALSLSVLEVAIASYEYRASLGSLDDTAGASACYDIGVALSSYARRLLAGPRQDQVKEEAIKYFKEAISLDPINDWYWNALGIAVFSSRPKTAQHAFIKALEIDSKNPATWTNLGLFYLYHEDTELANEAFYKAQVLDPDFALAWVGQGMVATANGHELESRALFEHAVSLPSPVPDADVAFAQRLFKRLASPGQQRSVDDMYPAFFVLDRYCKQHPQDASALHLFGLVCESIGHVQLGVDIISKAISILEAAYEESEDPVIEREYTIAHSNMGRLRLSLGDYEGALESFQVALNLLPDESHDETTRVLIAQSQLGSGLANFKLDQLEVALGFFEAAMESAAENPTTRGHVVVLLAQTLWAIGTEDGKESAKAQLLQSIQTDPENLMAINTLAGMGILTDDDSLVDAALSEILALPLEQRQERDPAGDVTYLLIQHHVGQGDVEKAISIAQKAVLTEPSQPSSRRQLASLTLCSGHSTSARAVLEGLSEASGDSIGQARESLGLQAIAECREEGKDQKVWAQRMAQKAVMLSPWRESNWKAMAFVRSCV